MPGLNAHQRPTAASTNPFEENVHRVSEYTAQEIATLAGRLEKQLGPEYISTRPGAGGSKVHYLAAEKVINLANEVFGFNGWSSQIQNVQVDFADENQNTGKISLGLSVIMRVTLRDGTFHEARQRQCDDPKVCSGKLIFAQDIGYGQIENCKGKAAAFEKAKKEGATDALKRALRNFGNVLGNCLYDKDYLQKITKIKVQPSKWDAENLHRHHDFAPEKKETTAPPTHERTAAPPIRRASTGDVEEEFGGDLLDEAEMNGLRPDEVMLPPSRPQTPKVPPARKPSGLSIQQQQGGPAIQHPVPRAVPTIPPAQTSNLSHTSSHQPPQTTPPDQTDLPPQHVPSIHRPAHCMPPEQNHHDQRPQAAPPPQPARPHEPPVGFITSRAAELLQHQPDGNLAAALPRFNPNADSPSIRKTSGFDHAKSAPIRRDNLQVAPAPPNADTPNATTRAQSTNFVNPSESLQRRIGAPGGAMSPVGNRGAFRAPTMAAGVKRPLPPQTDVPAQARPPLADVSNTIGQEIITDDPKRQRLAET